MTKDDAAECGLFQCDNGCADHFPWVCPGCGADKLSDRDSSDESKCETCADEHRRHMLFKRRQDDLECAADYEYDLRKDDNR